MQASLFGGFAFDPFSLFDEERQCFFARHGTDLTETPREQSFCHHCVAMREPLIVKDAAADPRFEDSPLVNAVEGFIALRERNLELAESNDLLAN